VELFKIKDMTAFTGGMTPTNFYSGLNSLNSNNLSIILYNVKAFGATGDGITDDTVAIQTGINAVVTAGGGVLYFPNGIYIISGALQTNIATVNYKSQLYIPQDSMTAGRVHISLVGEIPPNFFQSAGIGSATPPVTGVILKSTLVSSTSLSYVIASKGLAANYGSENYNDCSIENIQIRVAVDGSSRVTLGGIGFRDAINAIIRNVSVFPDINLVNSGIPQNNCVGIAMPKENCEHMNIVENCNVGGMESGYWIGEHTSLQNTVANSCKYGYNFGRNYHHARTSRIAAYWCINDIYISGESYMKVDGLQSEWKQAGKWYDSGYTILDPNNYGHGEIHYSIVEANVGFNNAKFTKSGGANLQYYPMAFTAASSFTVTGKRNDSTALTNLLTALAAKGIIIDSTTAS